MFLSQGTKRKLIINNVEMKDTGEITAKTNKDKSTAPLNVGILNEIMKEVTSDAFRSISGMVFGFLTVRPHLSFVRPTSSL